MVSSKQARIALEKEFPGLVGTPYEITSPKTHAYNCIAWAAKDQTRWWWPVGAYWPGQVPQVCSQSAFVMQYGLLGYQECASREPESGFERIALYAGNNSLITHAARQLPDGRWTSKLGQSFDITHSLEGLEGRVYGKVAVILKRPDTGR